MSGWRIAWLPLLPGWAVAALGVALLAMLIQGSVMLWRKKVPPRHVALLGGLRLLAILVFVACLSRPIVSWHKTVTRVPDLLVLLDASASMGVPGPAGRASRLDQTLAQMDAGGLTRTLADAFTLRWFGFDREARPLEPAGRQGLRATGQATDLGASLATMVSRYRQASAAAERADGSPACILLVTDGNDNGSADPVAVARELGLRLYVVPPADGAEPEPVPRVRVESLQGPSRIFLGAECRFRAMVCQDGVTNLAVNLELTEDGRPVLTQALNLGTDGERLVVLTYRPAALGIRRYALRATPSSGRTAEAGPPAEMVVTVQGRRNRVLLLEDTWRWDFKFLRHLMEDDPNFSFTAFLQRGSGIYMQFSEPDSTVKLSGFPQSAAELEWFDLFLVGDVKPGLWPPALAPALRDLVVEKGRSLIVVAGPNLARFVEMAPLNSLLPVELAPESFLPVPGPLDVRPTREGRDSSLFYSPPGGKAAGWKGLPAMDQVYAPVRKRPAATILLEVPDRANVFGNLIVMAEHTVGLGRVLYVGTDTLWKWQTAGAVDEEGNTPYRVFWQQALRAFASRQWSGGTVDLWVQTDRSRYAAGETVRLTAILDADRLPEAPEIKAELGLPDGRELPLALAPDPTRSRTFVSEFEAATSGVYRISALVRSEGKLLTEIASAVNVEPPGGELSRLRVNGDLLRRLAAVTGGGIVDPADPKTWPAGGEGDVIRLQETRTLDLWSSLTLPGLLVVVLGLDWLVRLLRGLV